MSNGPVEWELALGEVEWPEDSGNEGVYWHGEIRHFTETVWLLDADTREELLEKAREFKRISIRLETGSEWFDEYVDLDDEW